MRAPFGGRAGAGKGAGKGEDEVRLRRAQLAAFYEQHDPSKLPHIDAVMAQFAGKEDELLRMLAEARAKAEARSEEHTSELQSPM